LTARLNQQLIEVTISDDGQGIPEEHHKTIFNKFYQVVDEDGNPLRTGSGLGLAFCQLAVEAHGGHIWVDSKPDQGSNFSFTLPLANG
jgi:signal transduction histidine kinase